MLLFPSGPSTEILRVLGDALSGPPQPLPPPASIGVQAGSHLLSVSREAMACLFEIVLDAATYREMDFTWEMGIHYAPSELIDQRDARKRSIWRRH